MSNSTTHLDLVSSSQAAKEVTVNCALDAASPAMLYGRRASTTAALTWGFYGGTASVDGVPTQIGNGTIALTASATNYVEAGTDGSVSVNTSGFSVGALPLYQIVTGASTVASYTDLRVFGASAGSVSASDISDAITAHESASDPHPQYLTQTEGDARYAATASAGVTSVNGHTGAVTLGASDVGADSSGAASSAVTAHVAAADPHAQYALESTIGTANGIASLGGDGKVPTAQLPASATAGGTVTSVALTTPGLLFDVTGSPVTGAGTLAMSLKTQAANKFLAGPVSGADAAPTMRALTAADLPTQPFDLTAFYPGVPSASAIVTRVPVARAVTFPAGLTGSIGKASVAATAQTDFDVQKNGTSVGTIRFASGSASATFIAASVITLAAGDLVSIIAPATPDATLANVGLVLTGTR